MYTASVLIEGLAPLLQHRFAPSASKKPKAKKVTGMVDYSDEWKKTCFVNADSELYEPADHIEAAITKAAVGFKIPGRRGNKSFKDLCKAAVFVSPAAIPHLKAPSSGLTLEKTKALLAGDLEWLKGPMSDAGETNGNVRRLPDDPEVVKKGETTKNPVYVDVRPVQVQRARVERARLALNVGWCLAFLFSVSDDELPLELLPEILVDTGLKYGIGDNRPKNGRFRVVSFEEVQIGD